MTPSPPPDRTHVRFGLWSLGFWLLAGLVLEGLHGFKIAWYLDVTEDPRRHLLTLAHAHGTVLAVLNLILALVLPRLKRPSPPLVSRLFLVGSVALPAGFLLGGLFRSGTDPGLGIALTPMGALALIAASFLAARAA